MSDTGEGGQTPGFMTLDEVAAYLSVSPAQVYALVRSGDLPAIKIGGRGIWRVGRAQLEQYINQLHDQTRSWTASHPFNPREKDG